MSFVRPRQTPMRPARETTVWAVGSRVFVNCPGERGRLVGLTVSEDAGSRPVGTLGDGVEVEVLAWRPRGAGGTRYRVRACGDEVAGWVATHDLRATAVAPPREPAPAPAVPPVSTGRRFGDRA